MALADLDKRLEAELPAANARDLDLRGHGGAPVVVAGTGAGSRLACTLVRKTVGADPLPALVELLIGPRVSAAIQPPNLVAGPES